MTDVDLVLAILLVALLGSALMPIPLRPRSRSRIKANSKPKLDLTSSLPIPSHVRAQLSKLPLSSAQELSRTWVDLQSFTKLPSQSATAGLNNANRVDCSVFAPSFVQLDAPFIIQVLVHDFDDLARAMRLAQAADQTSTRRAFATLRTHIGSGSRIEVTLESTDFVIYNPVQSLVWNGAPSCAIFAAHSPGKRRASPNRMSGIALVAINGIPIGEIRFSVPIAADHSGTKLDLFLRYCRMSNGIMPGNDVVLAKRWPELGSSEVAHKLVTSHLRLVARIAMGYRGYGLPIGEVISEGNVGLMQAVKRFEPDKGFRVATYVVWWIRASIHEYILRSWSLVKLGSAAAQKKLFFNLRRTKGELQALEEGDLMPEHVEAIAKKLGVPIDDVISMNRRLSGDASLDAPVRHDRESGDWQDWPIDHTPSQDELLAENEELSRHKSRLAKAMTSLNDREKRIFEARRLAERPATLEDLSNAFGVSRERIRQIEVRAFEKVQSALVHDSPLSGVDPIPNATSRPFVEADGDTSQATVKDRNSITITGTASLPIPSSPPNDTTTTTLASTNEPLPSVASPMFFERSKPDPRATGLTTTDSQDFALSVPSEFHIDAAGDEARNYNTVFISYSRKDFRDASYIAQSITEIAGLKLALDVDTFEPGDEWAKRIPQLIESSDAFCLLWSTNANSSQWVHDESKCAVDHYDRTGGRQPRIRPILLETPAPEPPPHLKRFHFYSKWDGHRAVHKSGIFTKSR